MSARPLLHALLLFWLALPMAQAGSDWAALKQRLNDDPVSLSSELRQLMDSYRQQGTQRDELAAILLLIEAKLNIEEFSELGTLLARGQQLAKALADPRAQARLGLAESRRLAQLGDIGAAHRAVEAVFSLARQYPLGEEQALAYVEKAQLLQDESRISEALPLLLRAHKQFSELGLAQAASNALNDIGNLYSAMDNHGEAAAYYQRALAGLDPRHNRHALSIRLYNLGASLHLSNQLPQAERTLREALAYSEALKDETGVAFARYRLGLILLAQGRASQALGLFDQALLEFERGDNLEMRFASQSARAEALALSGPRFSSRASQALNQARALLESAPNPRRELALHEAASRVYKALGQYPAALAELESWARSYRTNNDQLNRQLLSEMQARFETERREAENALLKSEQRRQAAELQAGQSRRLLLWLGLGFSLVLALALAVLLLRQVRQKRRFADLALLDELTGAPNRRHILAYARRQLLICREIDQPYSLAVIDLDHFKAINDQFGHEQGDAVLRSFASAGQGVLRRGDRLGRIGGEEWLLVMPSTSLAEIDHVFQRMREAVRTQSAEGLPSELRISFSMGAAQVQAGESFEKLLQRADAAMYQAKQRGRDRLCLSEPVGPSTQLGH